MGGDGRSDRRIELREMLDAPMGCAFLVLLSRSGLDPVVAVRPPAALDLAARARDLLDPWSGHQRETIAEIIGAARRLRTLCEEVVAQADTDWWSSALDRERQLWVAHCSDRRRRQVVTPSRPSGDGDAYAQRPAGWTFTVTDYNGRTSAHAALAHLVGDEGDTDFPIDAERMIVDDVARVCEVRSALDWHRLAVTCGGADTKRGSAAPHGVLEPEWWRVAESWDGVHLTFRGFLTAVFVTTEDASGRSRLWAWEGERTLWMRDRFVIRLPAPAIDRRPGRVVDAGPVSLVSARPDGVGRARLRRTRGNASR